MGEEAAREKFMRAPLSSSASCAAWLDELLGKLSDRPAHLVGMSYDGWVAMSLASLTPMPLLRRLHQTAYWVTTESRLTLGPEQTVVAVRQPFSPKGAARA